MADEDIVLASRIETGGNPKTVTTSRGVHEEFELEVQGDNRVDVTDERLAEGKVVGIGISSEVDYEQYYSYVELDFPQLQQLAAELTRRVEKGAPRG